ncbi:MAG: hypothetical protein QW040_00035 [Candidatus Aenigmatarchaeota archaeon]
MNEKALCLSLLITFLAFLTNVRAENVNDTATINVSVKTVAQISVVPSVLSWTNVQPGQTGGTKLLDIINIGSLNVTQIYAYVDTLTDETKRPYGSSNATEYAAGGVIVLKNETYNKFFFAGRIEWNWTEEISNLQKNNVNSPVAWGFFKNTSFEYIWLLGNGTNGYCNNTGAQFAIEDDVDNGTVETRTPTTSNIQLDSGDVNWGYFSVNRATAPLYGSCVAAYYDCTKIYIYKYDKRSGFTSCANSRYIQEYSLPPGNIHTLTLNVYAPYGIPSGNLNVATLTVYASG